MLYTSRHSVLFCLHVLQACHYHQPENAHIVNVCIFRPLAACFFFLARVCTCVCVCEFANVLWLCFSFWKFLWCVCLFIYLCCVQAFSAVKATVDVLCTDCHPSLVNLFDGWTSDLPFPASSFCYYRNTSPADWFHQALRVPGQRFVHKKIQGTVPLKCRNHF